MRETMMLVWLVAVIVFTTAEVLTLQLISVWFVFGSICALIGAALGLPPGWQCALFLVAAAATLLGLRPFVKRYVTPRKTRTNADRVIGEVAVVTQTIDNIAGLGAAKVDGKEWTARSVGGEIIHKDARVRVERIEGVKLIVSGE